MTYGRSTRAAAWKSSCAVAVLCLIAAGSAFAQAPAPRDIPEGFVLPGPAPTNAPAPSSAGGAPATPAAPGQSGGASNAAAPAAAAGTRPTVSGSMVTAPQAVMPTAGTTRFSSGTTTQSRTAHAWPCVQRKVDTVTAGQVWAGPPLESAASTERTAAMRQLVSEVAARRLPLPQAQKAALDFLAALPEEQREPMAVALFADILQTMDAERASVMRGIERYGARQQDLAVKLREQNAELSAIRQSGDAAKASEAQEALLWDTRVFDERRRSLTYVCEVPILIEQRLFALGRTIGGAL